MIWQLGPAEASFAVQVSSLNGSCGEDKIFPYEP